MANWWSDDDSSEDDTYVDLIPNQKEIEPDSTTNNDPQQISKSKFKSSTKTTSNEDNKTLINSIHCYFCPKSFITENEVHNHTKKKHPKLAIQYSFKGKQCLKCKAKFSFSLSFHGLMSHIAENKCKLKQRKIPIVTILSSESENEPDVTINPSKTWEEDNQNNSKGEFMESIDSEDEKVEFFAQLGLIPYSSHSLKLIDSTMSKQNEITTRSLLTSPSSELVPIPFNPICSSFICRNRDPRKFKMFCKTCRLKGFNQTCGQTNTTSNMNELSVVRTLVKENSNLQSNNIRTSLLTPKNTNSTCTTHRKSKPTEWDNDVLISSLLYTSRTSARKALEKICPKMIRKSKKLLRKFNKEEKKSQKRSRRSSDSSDVCTMNENGRILMKVTPLLWTKVKTNGP